MPEIEYFSTNLHYAAKKNYKRTQCDVMPFAICGRITDKTLTVSLLLIHVT